MKHNTLQQVENPPSHFSLTKNYTFYVQFLWFILSFTVFLCSLQGFFFSALIATFVSYWTPFQLLKKKKQKRQHQTGSSQAE